MHSDFSESEGPPVPAYWHRSCDLLVIGSGAGGLAAAITATEQGLNVLVVEKEPKFGGATARSGGWLWIPANRLAQTVGMKDSRDDARTYLKHCAGQHFDAARVESFLEAGPAMVDFLLTHTRVKLEPLSYPDYHPEYPGGTMEGRSLRPLPIDGSVLGAELARLRLPLASATILGIQPDGPDIFHFYSALRNWKSFAVVTRKLLRRLIDQVRAGRSMQLTNGNALVAALAASAFDRGISLLTSAAARSLIEVNGHVIGAIVDIDGALHNIRAHRGVVLATGGFPHDSKRRAGLFPTGATEPQVWGMMPYGNTGDGLAMAETLGATVELGLQSTLALAPISRMPSPEGSFACFPVFTFRGVPGVIAVTREGRRFVNEASSYHEFGLGMLEANVGNKEAIAFLICDHATLRRFGLGPVRPAPIPITTHLSSGFLTRGNTLGDLARVAGIAPDRLVETVEAFNSNARNGIDPDFNRGKSGYDVANGDPSAAYPALGPLGAGPYYALKVHAGSVGTFAGLRTDANARVLGRNGEAIQGLYAAGNDLASITGGDYVGGGCTIGPAMTFGYIAALHAAQTALVEYA